MTGALHGARVLVTGSDPDPLCALLRVRGATPLAVPTIAIHPADPAPLDAALARVLELDWIVVTSAHGARSVQDRLAAAGASVPETVRWAAVGPRTAAALARDAACLPDGGTGGGIADAMGHVGGQRVLLARARGAAADLPELLRARGAIVDEVVAYDTEEGPESSREPLRRALAGGLDAAVFTSGSTVRGFARLAGRPAEALAGAIVVAIGPTTAEAARAAGLAPALAASRTPEAIVEAIGQAMAPALG